MSLMSLLLQSLLGFSTLLVLFLIYLNHSFLLASGFINYGARLGHFFFLCLYPQGCWHLNWFVTFLAMQQPLGSSLQHHKITSPWHLPIGRLISVLQFCCSCHSWYRATNFFIIRVALVDTTHSLEDSEGEVIPVSEVGQITSHDSWHSGQCSVQICWYT